MQHEWPEGLTEGVYQMLHVASFITKTLMLKSTDSALDRSVNLLLLLTHYPRKRKVAFILQVVNTSSLCIRQLWSYLLDEFNLAVQR